LNKSVEDWINEEIRKGWKKSKKLEEEGRI